MPPLLPLIKKSGFDEYANLETPQPYTFPAPSLVNGAYRNIAISYILHLYDTDTALSVFGWQSNITVCEDTNDFRKGQSVFSGAGQSQTIIIRSSFFHYWFQFTCLHRRTPERMKEKNVIKGDWNIMSGINARARVCSGSLMTGCVWLKSQRQCHLSAPLLNIKQNG